MPMPNVSTKVIDLSTRVNSTGTYYAAIVVAAKKGPINTPTIVTSQTDFLTRFSPDGTLEIGWDTAYFEAIQYLATQSNLYVVRAADEDTVKYGGCQIRTFKSELANESLTEGFSSDDNIPFTDYTNTSMVIYGANQGAYNNNISISIITDPDVVKLDEAFIIKVYSNGTEVESHTCSLNPSLKDGYGVNCYAETVLVASNYIRADVNDDDDVIQDTSSAVTITGTVSFTNETIASTNVARANYDWAAGAVIKVTELEGVTAYYEATQAGKTDSTLPTWVEKSAYLTSVEDGEVIWTLKETVKAYETAASFTKGEIVSVTSGNQTLYYRAMTSGVSDFTAPTWIDASGSAEYVLQDGTITWTNQTQDATVSEQTGYTYAENVAKAKLDLTKYSVYTDSYLAEILELATTVTIEDPTLAEAEMVEMSVTYEAVYTGTVSDVHYSLPKASTKTDGVYEKTYLAGGSDGDEVQDGARIIALTTLANTNDVTGLALIMDGGNATATYHQAINTVCESRDDSCHGIISVPYIYEQGMVSGDAPADVLSYRKTVLNGNTTNLELYVPHQLIYDQYNDRDLYVSPSCFVAARIMDVAQTYGWHYASAGVNRGVVNSLDVSKAYDTTYVDSFSDNQINTIIKDPGYGNVIMDDLTLLSTACDMQEAHISRYINIKLRPALKSALKPFLFEFNDEATRTLIVKMLETYMEPEKAARAVYDYYVVCDSTNNLDSDIQNNILNCWLYVKPMKLAKFIVQSIIVSPYGTEFGDLSF